MKNYILAIDIGSNKICVIIAEKGDDGHISVTGAGTAKSQGIKKGSITNIELAAKSIKSALGDAKRVAGVSPTRAVVSISGAFTKSFTSDGIVNIPNQEITFKEIDRVMSTALYNADIPNEYEALHTLPYNFIVDGQEFIEDPLGMNASRLKVDAHIIAVQKTNLNNLKKAVYAAGVEVETVVLAGYASAISVLNPDEKALGAAVVDMGGSSCNIVIHAGNSLRYNDFVAVGSNHITSDLSTALHTPLFIAENVKIQYGSLFEPDADAIIELPVIGDEDTTHEGSLGVVHNVIFARVEETLMIIDNALEKSGLKHQLGAGVILTGGFTQLPGLRELAIAVFGNIPVRLAKPNAIDGMFEPLYHAAYATSTGLVRYASGEFVPYEIGINNTMRSPQVQMTESITRPKVTVEEAPEARAAAEQESLAVPDSPSAEVKMTSIEAYAEQDKTRFSSKFWNWVTQLF